MQETTTGNSGVPTSDRRALIDPYERTGFIPLDSYFEKHEYSPVLMTFLVLLLAFVLFQLVISPVAVILLLIVQGVPLNRFIEVFTTRMADYGSVILVGNGIGLILGIALPAYLIARLHSSKVASFLRIRRVDLGIVGLGILGLAGLIPFVQWTATLNQSMPMPDWLRELEKSQMDLIEQILMQKDLNVLFNLVVLAVIPAFCEELLFRGYIQRQAERGFGLVGGILFSGIAFGLYHLRLSQALPLSILGIYLAYLVWRTGSLWVPVVVHFVNNAFSVGLGAYLSANPEIDADKVNNMDIPWFYVVGGLGIFFGSLYILRRRTLIPTGTDRNIVNLERSKDNNG